MSWEVEYFVKVVLLFCVLCEMGCERIGRTSHIPEHLGDLSQSPRPQASGPRVLHKSGMEGMGAGMGMGKNLIKIDPG